MLDMARQDWRKIVNITVDRTTGFCTIKYENDNLGSTDNIFAARVPANAKLRASTKLVVNAILTRELIIAIADDLKKIAESEQRNRSAALQRTEESEERIRRHGHRTGRANARRLKEGKKP